MDYKFFRRFVKLQKRKNWLIPPPQLNINSKSHEKLTCGEGVALWDVAKNKLVGLTILEIFESQAKDPELKLLISLSIKNVTVPHIKRIQKILHSEGAQIPYIQERTNLDIIGKDTGPIKFVEDNQIAESLREIVRLAVTLVTRGIIDSVRDDVLDLLWDIMEDDFKAFKGLFRLQRQKNWILSTPVL